MDGETLPIRPRKRAARPTRADAKDRPRADRLTLNLTISRKARSVLHAHQNHYRGTDRGTASGLVEWLILEHLRLFRVNDHTSSGQDKAPAEGGADSREVG